MASKPIDLTDRRFGRLVVVSQNGRKRNRVVWACQCDCGNTHDVVSSDLLNDETNSCGCLRKENKLQKVLADDFTVDSVIITNLTQKIRSDSTTGHKGIYKVSRKQGGVAYTAYITVNKRQIHLGTHHTLEKAIAVRLAAEEKYFKPIIEKHASRKED